MDNLLQDIAVEEEHVVSSLRALEQAQGRRQRTVVELAAIATFVQNRYNGMENLIKRAMHYSDALPPQSPSFHRDLLDQAVEQRVISRELSEELDAYRGFRHFFVHGYGVMLREAQLMPLVQHLPVVWKQFRTELISFAESFRECRESGAYLRPSLGSADHLAVSPDAGYLSHPLPSCPALYLWWS